MCVYVNGCMNTFFEECRLWLKDRALVVLCTKAEHKQARRAKQRL